MLWENWLSLRQLNLLQPEQDVSVILRDLHVAHLLRLCITAYIGCSRRNNDSGRPPAAASLLLLYLPPLPWTVLKSAVTQSLIFNMVVSSSSLHTIRQLQVNPCSSSKGFALLAGTKRCADLYKEAMTMMCQTSCNCHLIPAHFKKDDHLLTTSLELLPGSQLQKTARMCSKHRPSPYAGNFNSWSGPLQSNRFCLCYIAPVLHMLTLLREGVAWRTSAMQGPVVSLLP